MQEKIYMIDSISPFFINYPKNKVNWSKIPFSFLEKTNIDEIENYFIKYIQDIYNINYNSISIDELCYLAILDFYNPELKENLTKYQIFFKKLFKIIKEKNMKIFVTSDIMFYNKDIQNSKLKEEEILKLALENLFNTFPEIDGIIFRIGESDGLDISGDFKSSLYLKTPRQVNNFIKYFLPLFEKKNKLFIFRTWTLGAYSIGDLIWNKKTYQKSFSEINSQNFIISMKFGDTDFFRYLKLNELFFEDNIQKIIELQTRREYEGFGEFPSFVGWDYKKYYDKLKNLNSLVGISVWCQTGGWSSFKNLSFVENSSFWNEINTYVTIKIFKENFTVENAISSFNPAINSEKLIEFLKISDFIIK